MKCRRLLAAALALGVAVSATSPAWAHGRHRSHARVGVFVGAPLWPWWYYPPAYYPPVITVPAPPPPVYIEQPKPPPAQNYWYYCSDPEGYYPYVKECPGGWQQVAPQP